MKPDFNDRSEQSLSEQNPEQFAASVEEQIDKMAALLERYKTVLRTDPRKFRSISLICGHEETKNSVTGARISAICVGQIHHVAHDFTIGSKKLLEDISNAASAEQAKEKASVH